jgi:hypothetical protein
MQPPVVEQHDPRADLAALGKLAERCERFSPLVGWETITSGSTGTRSTGTQVTGTQVTGSRAAPPPAHLLLDITGIGRLFGGEAALVAELRAALQAWGYCGHGAVADSIGAAWACAGPDWPVIPPGESRQAIASRPIAALRLPLATIDSLRQLGVERIEQLGALPRASWAARFGPSLALRYDQAHGDQAHGDQAHGDQTEWIRPYHAPPPFALDRCLDEPAWERAGIERLVQETLEQLAEQLRQAGAGALALQGRLDCADGRPIELKIGLFRPSACPHHWLGLMRMQMERIEWPGPVGRVGIRVTAAAPLAERQRELFTRREGPDDGLAGPLLERLGSRLGPAAVCRPRLVDAALPERAFRYQPAVGLPDLPDAVPGLRPARRPPSRSRRSRSTSSDPSSAPDANEVSRGHQASWRDSWRDAPRAGDVGEGLARYAVSLRPLELLQPPQPIRVLAPQFSSAPSSSATSSSAPSSSATCAEPRFGDTPSSGPQPVAAAASPPVMTATAATPTAATPTAGTLVGASLAWQGRSVLIRACAGPERIETGWWGGAAARRDYYRVETESGARYWIFRDLAASTWFLHGLFT